MIVLWYVSLIRALIFFLSGLPRGRESARPGSARPLLVENSLAAAADADPRPVGLDLGTDARAPVALAADHHHVAGVDGRLAFGDAPLDVALRVGLGVLLDETHALHDDPVFGREDLQHLPLLARVTAGDDLHRVVLLEAHPCVGHGFGGGGHGYRTSGA